MGHTERVIVLVDMDCFYCQVEELFNPSLMGKPLAVVQYNAWQGGGIIAVNYPAKDKGVTRHMRGVEAKAKCPDIELVSVPTSRGKADLTKYREAGKRVAAVLHTFTPLLERASVDEAYLDITAEVQKRKEAFFKVSTEHLLNTHVVAYDTEQFLEEIYSSYFADPYNLNLAIGGAIAEEIRSAVYSKTGYRCSAGIAHNKILAKLVAGLHKPNQQTILPHSSVQELYKTLPIKKITSLGGKFGALLSENLGVRTMGELCRFSEKDLQKKYDLKTSSWLYNIARGIDRDPVTTRLISKSISCCKKFPGSSALATQEALIHWIGELAQELAERLEKDQRENNRKAKSMVVSYVQEIKREDISNTKTHPLNCYEYGRIAQDTLEVIKKHCIKGNENFRIKYLGISASKFEDYKNKINISSFFKQISANENCDTQTEIKEYKNALYNSKITDSFEMTEKSKNDNANVMKLVLAEKSQNLELINHSEQDTACEHSVFSQSTEYCSENEEMVYIDESYHYVAEKAECTTSMSVKEDSSENDSISNEICNENGNIPGSFFKQYFDGMTTPESIPNRDFNTSRILEESNNSDVNYNESVLECTDLEAGPSYENNNSKLTNDSYALKEVNEDKEVCVECRKVIPKMNIISHMDYHFALKIVKEESHMYNKPNKKDAQTQRKIATTKAKKRKNSCTLLTSFLQKNKTEDVDTENCLECNKKIALDELQKHMDYHAAKKLHLQLNPVNTATQTPKQIKNEQSSKNKLVTSYFKPL